MSIQSVTHVLSQQWKMDLANLRAFAASNIKWINSESESLPRFIATIIMMLGRLNAAA